MTAGPGPGPYDPHPPHGPPPYGQQSPHPGYGPAPSTPTGHGPVPPVERPLTVRAGLGAFVGSIVLSVVSYGIVLLNPDMLARVAAEGAGLGRLSPEEAEVVAAMGDTFGVLALLVGLLGTGIFALFVWFAWRGHNWARIVLWVLAGLGILAALSSEGSSASFGAATPPVLTFLTSVEALFDAVGVVLLALPPSNDWYRRRSRLRSSGPPG